MFSAPARRAQVLARVKGAALEGLQLGIRSTTHVPVILGEHVTLESGTGAVHTAPGHGQEDFVVGQKYSLPVDNPVGGDGRFLHGTPFFAGVKVFEANKHVIEVLDRARPLLHHETIAHSYPHCWRHKTPVIFRATPQWFISMEQAGLRSDALREIGKVEWTPGLGRAAHLQHDRRPSRLVHLAPAHLGRADRAVHASRDAASCIRARRSCSSRSRGAWRRTASTPGSISMPATLLGADAADYEKVTDIMDVWFDSGVSHQCVSQSRPEILTPADLYLEGSDQHRGWFHSSLLTSVALNGRAPYKGVLTHGFTVDEKGRKMSKSLGNVMLPQKVVSTLGADVLRLWVAATDYANEMSVSDEILKRISDSYRRMRNTVRFLLGNLAGFDPARDAVPVDADGRARPLGAARARANCRRRSSRRIATTSST